MRPRTLRQLLLRLGLTATAVLTGTITIAAVSGYSAVARWESEEADRSSATVPVLLARQAAQAGHAAEERSYMSEPADVVAGRNVDAARRRLSAEETHFLAVNGYTFLVVANAARHAVFEWAIAPDGPPAEAASTALFNRLDRDSTASGYLLQAGDGAILIGASRLHNEDGSIGQGYLVLGRPLDAPFVGQFDPDRNVHVRLRFAGPREATETRVFSADSIIVRQPFFDLFGRQIGTVETAFSRDAQRALLRWGASAILLLFLSAALLLSILWRSARRLVVAPIRSAIKEVESMRHARAIRPLHTELPVAEWEVLRATFNQAVLSLTEFQRRYRDLFERAADAMFVIEPATGRVIDANPATSLLTGVDPANLIGQVLPAELQPHANGQRTVRWQRPDGVTMTWGMATSEISFENGRWILASFRDLTGREALAHVHKMEAVGSLAGGIAHDFNNLMGAVLSGVAAARRLVAPDAPAHAALNSIEHAGTRAADLTKQLLSFSRHDPLRVEPVDLSEAIETVRSICQRTFNAQITIDTFVPGDLPKVMGDAGEIEQALLNLCINARDAMPHGGLLRIDAHRVQFDAEDARAAGAPRAGAFISIAVSDAGTGIPDEVKARIFEPYFTTKEPGRGTGLGLSLAYSLARQLGGSIDVHSTVGIGTQVTLFFPALAEDRSLGLQAPVAAPAHPTPAPTDRPAILLVDDERMLREMLRMVLDLSGFQVLEAEDGTSALARLAEHRAEIRAILLDVQLPGELNGVETLERIRALDAHLPVILYTGFAGDDELAYMRQLTVDDVLSKPVDIPALLEKLNVLCGRPREPLGT
jgi:signal transduction histidine kinase/ActR/RegA family two-component response regulator